MGKKDAKLTGGSTAAAEGRQQSLVPLVDIRLRKMFGGYRVFAEDPMFALVDSGGTIFFKANDSNLATFQAAGSEKHGRMPYYQVPAAVLADEDTLRKWAQSSIQVAKKGK